MATNPYSISDPDLLPNSRKMMMAALLKQMGQPQYSAPGAGLNALAMGLMGYFEGQDAKDNLKNTASLYEGTYGGKTPDIPPYTSPPLTGAPLPRPSASPAATGAYTPPEMPVEGGGTVAMPPPRPVMDRNQFVEEANNPVMAQRLATVVQGETGRGASPEQQQIQLETVLNRAKARDQSLADVTQMYTGPGSKGYYPQSTFTNGSASPEETANFQKNILAPALRGTDTSSAVLGFPATGNASGGVADRGIANGRYTQYASLGPPGQQETYVQQPGGREDISRLDASRLGAPPTQVAQNGPVLGGQTSQRPLDPAVQQLEGIARDPNQSASTRQRAYDKAMELRQSGKFEYKSEAGHLWQVDPRGIIPPTDVTPGRGFKALTDPQERASFGIPADDRRPYQVDTTVNKLINPPAENRINIDQRGPNKFEDTYGEEMGKRAVATVAEGEKAAGNVQNIRLMRQINSQLGSGKLTPGISTIGGYLQSAGINPESVGIDKTLPAKVEAFTGLANQQLLGLLGPGGFPSQNFSDTDRKYVEKILASPYDRPETNDLKLQIAERLQMLKVEKAQAWSAARDRGESYEKFERGFNGDIAKRDMFKDLYNSPAVGGGQPNQSDDGYSARRVR